MQIVIASDPQRDDLFAEIHVQGQPWAEVIYDRSKEAYTVTILPSTEDEEEWSVFDLADVRRALLEAKEALVSKGYPDLTI